jgi:hypothetical protein
MKERVMTESKKVEISELTPEVQQLIAQKVAETQRAAADMFAKMQLKQPSWIKRAWRELVLPKPEGLEVGKVKLRQDALRRGMLCLMACRDSGFKARKGITDMTDIEIQARADMTVTEILSLQLYVLAAESVILRHGLKDEYTSITDKIQQELRPLYPMPTAEEMKRMQDLLAGGKDGVGIAGFSDAGTESVGDVATEGVRDNQQEETPRGESGS